MSENKIIITGLLLPKDRVSRNKVLYDWSSIKSNYKKLIGLPLLYNHLNEGDKKPIGKFIDSYLKENDDKDGIAGWYYKADVNPNSEYADSVVRGDLSKVSIQVMAENQRKEQASDGSSYTRAFISDVLEGSVVPTPGYMETSINIVREQFNQSDMILSESFKVIQKKESTRDIITEIDGKKKILTVSGSGFRAVDEDGVTYINVKGEWQKEKFKIREYVEPANENEVNVDELQKGIEVELEHIDDVDKAKTIALQHLAEIPDYYTRLAKMENEAKEEKEQITTDNVPTQTKVVAKEYTDSDLEDAYQKLQSKDKVKKYILLRDLGKTHNDAINTIIRESFSAFDRLYEMFEADDKYKNMTVQQAKQILGDRSKWELENMKKALTKMRAINTEEEEQRLAAVRVMLKQKESFSSLDRLYESVCKENSAIIVKNGPNEYVILDDKNQQRGNVYKTISDAKKDAVKLGLKVKESLSSESVCKEDISPESNKAIIRFPSELSANRAHFYIVKILGIKGVSQQFINGDLLHVPKDKLDIIISELKNQNIKYGKIIKESLSSESVCKEQLERGTSFGFHNKDHSKTAVGDKWEISDKYYVQFYSNGSYKRTILYNTKDAAIRAAKKYTESMMNKESLSSESVCKEKLERGTRVTVKLPSVKPFKGVIEDINGNICTIRKSNGRVEDVNSLYVYEEILSSFDKLYEKVCKEGFLEIPDMYENTVKTLGIKYSKTPNDTLIVSDADVVKKTLNKAKIPYFEESLSNESVLKENIYSDYKIGSIVKYKGKKYEIVEFEDDMHSSATLVPERGGAKIRGVNLFNLPIVEESLSNESVCKENSAIIVKNGPNEYVILDDKNQQRGNVYKTISDAKKDAVKLGLKVKESISSESVCKELKEEYEDFYAKDATEAKKKAEEIAKKRNKKVGVVRIHPKNLYSDKSDDLWQVKLESISSESLKEGNAVEQYREKLLVPYMSLQNNAFNIKGIKEKGLTAVKIKKVFIRPHKTSNAPSGVNCSVELVIDDDSKEVWSYFEVREDLKDKCLKQIHGVNYKSSALDIRSKKIYSLWLFFDIKNKESLSKLNKLHESVVCREKYLGTDEIAYTTDGKPITKTGTIKLNREEFGDVEHELFTGGNIKIATNAKRPSGGVCNDRMCAIHTKGKHPARFLIHQNGVEVTIKGKRYNGDSYKCNSGGEIFIELDKDAEPYKESLSKEGFKIGDEVTYNGMKAKITGYYANDEEYEILVNGQYMFVPISKLKK